MSKDRYYRNISCPDCGRGGKAYIIENDGWTFMNRGNERHVQSVPLGFTVVNHGNDHNEETVIDCECGGIALMR